MAEKNKHVTVFDDGSAFVTVMISKETLKQLKEAEKDLGYSVDALCEIAVENAATGYKS